MTKHVAAHAVCIVCLSSADPHLNNDIHALSCMPLFDNDASGREDRNRYSACNLLHNLEHKRRCSEQMPEEETLDRSLDRRTGEHE